MKIRYKKGEGIYLILALLLIFYYYNTTFQEIFFKSRMISVLVICIVTFLCLTKSFSIKQNKQIKIILTAWGMLAVVSLIGNQDLLYGSESRWLLPMAGIFALISLSKKKYWIRYYIAFSKFFILLHSFFTIFFFVFKELYLDTFVKLIPGDHAYLISKFNMGAMPGITGHYSTNGIYLGFGLIFFAVDLFLKKRKNSNELIHECAKFFFVLVALILTQKRAHILFGFLAIFIMYYVYNSDRKVSRWFYILFSTIILGNFILVTAQFVPAIVNVINRFIYADGGELTNGRIWFWKFALLKFRENPLLGIGWGGFKHEYYKVIGSYASTSDWVDCHNVFLQILCEQGIIGEILFFIATIGALRINWIYLKKGRQIKNFLFKDETKLLTLTLGIQAFFIMYCFTGNCLYDCEAFFPYVLAVAAAFTNINDIYIRTNTL